jgi:acetyl-CoA carboxylase biotin carboxyl carrier protein
VSTLTALDSEELIRLFELSDWQELALQVGGCELVLSKNREADAPWAATPRASAEALLPEHPGDGQEPAPGFDGSSGENLALPLRSIVTAPSLGTFYPAAKPGAAAFVEVGQQVGKDTELCLIEVMKRFTALRAGVAGTVREVYAKEGELVEFAQPLFLIDTHG